MITGESETVDKCVIHWNALFEEMPFSDRIADLRSEYPKKKSVNVSFEEIQNKDGELLDFLSSEPSVCLRAGSKVVSEIAGLLDDHRSYVVKVRITGLPADLSVSIGSINTENLGKLATIHGRVNKIGSVRPRLINAVFKCKKCTAMSEMTQTGFQIEEPLECEACGLSKPETRFLFMNDLSTYEDYQEIELEEPSAPWEISGAKRISVVFQGDLVGSLSEGEEVKMHGIITTKEMRKGLPVITDFLLVCSSYDKVVKSGTVMTGTTSRERTELETVFHIIKDLLRYSNYADLDEVFTEAKLKGLTSDQTKSMIAKLKSSGQIYEPFDRKLKVIS